MNDKQHDQKTVDSDVIDLGAARVETRGHLISGNEDTGGRPMVAGISDLD